MPHDLHRRTQHWKEIAPGLWLDPEGFVHIFPDEVCAHVGIPYTEENYKLVVEVFTEDMPRILGVVPKGFKFIKHERES